MNLKKIPICEQCGIPLGHPTGVCEHCTLESVTPVGGHDIMKQTSDGCEAAEYLNEGDD